MPGAKSVYFPLLVPLSFLSKEASHVEGFAKECAGAKERGRDEKELIGYVIVLCIVEQRGNIWCVSLSMCCMLCCSGDPPSRASK